MMRILYLAHRIPYPPNKGDKIRSFNEIKFLSKRHEIHLACLADKSVDIKYKDKLKKYCKSVEIILISPLVAKLKSLCYLLSGKPLSVPYFYSRKLQKIVNQSLSTINFDIVLCFSSPMAEYIFKANYNDKSSTSFNSSKANRQILSSTKLIMDFVDLDSDKWLQYSKYTRFPLSWIYCFEAKRLSVYEQKIIKKFDHSIFVSEQEVELFRKHNPDAKNVTAISNGVDFEFFSPMSFNSLSNASGNTINYQQLHKGRPILVFTGAMDYFANVEGVKWFVRDILPLIRREIPDVIFYVVGNNPVKEIRKLEKCGEVVVTGYVEDVREYFFQATVCIAPLRIARGVQNKILEAMAMGVPVVATPQALAGFGSKMNGDISGEDNPEIFAKKVIQIIQSRDLQKILSRKERDMVMKEYNWDQNLNNLEKTLFQTLKN